MRSFKTVTIVLFSCRNQVALKIMNLSSEHCNISDWLMREALVKASVYVVPFSFATFITIIAIVLQNLTLWEGPRYPPLSPSAVHLLLLWPGSGLSPAPCWVVFGAHLSVGEGILFTLPVNTHLAICWLLKSVLCRFS